MFRLLRVSSLEYLLRISDFISKQVNKSSSGTLIGLTLTGASVMRDEEASPVTII